MQCGAELASTAVQTEAQAARPQTADARVQARPVGLVMTGTQAGQAPACGPAAAGVGAARARAAWASAAAQTDGWPALVSGGVQVGGGQAAPAAAQRPSAELRSAHTQTAGAWAGGGSAAAGAHPLASVGLQAAPPTCAAEAQTGKRVRWAAGCQTSPGRLAPAGETIAVQTAPPRQQRRTVGLQVAMVPGGRGVQADTGTAPPPQGQHACESGLRRAAAICMCWPATVACDLTGD